MTVQVVRKAQRKRTVYAEMVPVFSTVLFVVGARPAATLVWSYLAGNAW